MKVSNIITWLLLVTLTIAAFLFSEGNITGNQLVLFLMAITIIKFTGIGWQFVELKHAHVFWRIIFTGFILCFALLVYGFA